MKDNPFKKEKAKIVNRKKEGPSLTSNKDTKKSTLPAQPAQSIQENRIEYLNQSAPIPEAEEIAKLSRLKRRYPKKDDAIGIFLHNYGETESARRFDLRLSAVGKLSGTILAGLVPLILISTIPLYAIKGTPVKEYWMLPAPFIILILAAAVKVLRDTKK